MRRLRQNQQIELQTVLSAWYCVGSALGFLSSTVILPQSLISVALECQAKPRVTIKRGIIGPKPTVGVMWF